MEAEFQLLNSGWGPLALGLGLVVLGTRYLLRRRLSSLLSWGELALKVGALIALGLALCVPTLVDEVVLEETEVVIDISESFAESEGNAALERLQVHTRSSRGLRVRPFGRSVGMARADLPSSFGRYRQGNEEVGIGASNLEEALLSLSGQRDATVFFLTDGYETAGQVQRSLQTLRAAGVRIYPLTGSSQERTRDELRLVELHAPLLASSLQSTPIQSVVKNSSTEKQRGQLRLEQDGVLVHEEEVSLLPGQEVVVTSSLEKLPEGISQLRSTFTPENTRFSASSEYAYVAGEEREKIALIASEESDAKVLESILKDQAFQLDVLVTKGSRLGALPELQEYSVVLLVNVPLKQLPFGAAGALEEWVREGGSLAMIGGNQSFGLGGYKDSPIDRALPVRSLTPRKEKKRLNVAVQLVMDKSGSMKQGSKITFARLAAKQVVKSLKAQDYFGLIAFDNQPFVIQPIGRVGSIRERALRAPDDLMHPTGTTNLFPALDRGIQNLLKVPAGRKHLIVLTDGKIPDASARGDLYMKVVGDARLQYGVTVSTFLIGADSGALLREIARQGGGAFHRTFDVQSLPRLFLKDVAVSTGDQTQREALQYDVRKGERLLSTTLDSFPSVLGYVKTEMKPDATKELVAFGQGSKEPLLASWRYGKGKSLAYTSDVSGRWSKHWLQWSRVFEFWDEIISSLRPETAAQGPIQFDVKRYFAGGDLTLDLQVFTEGLQGAVTAELVAPNGESQNLVFSPQAIGRFTAKVPEPVPGKYELALAFGSQSLTRVAFHLSGEAFGEKKGRGVDRALLEEIASGTGGKVNPEVADVIRKRRTRQERLDVSYLAMALALLLLVLSIAWRERRALRLLSGSRFVRFLQRKAKSV